MHRRFQSPIIYLDDINEHLASDYPVICSRHISAINKVVIERIPGEKFAGLRHVKFAIRLDNRDSFSACLKNIPLDAVDLACRFMSQQRLLLLRSARKADNAIQIVLLSGGIKPTFK